MTKHFYSHLVTLDQINQALSDLQIVGQEREELYALAHDHIHHAIMDEILSSLSDTDKEIFLKHLTNDAHEQVWQHLNQKIENIESRIQSVANQLIQELHQDVKDLK